MTHVYVLNLLCVHNCYTYVHISTYGSIWMILLTWIRAVALCLEGDSVNMKKPNLVSLHGHSKVVNFTDQITFSKEYHFYHTYTMDITYNTR